MHRLHEDDLVGHVLGQEDWELVRLPAIAEADETILYDSRLGQRCFERRRGEALHPAREPLAMLEQIRKTRAVRAEYEHWRPEVVLIEDKASGTQLIQELIADGVYAVTRYLPQADKVMRMHAQTAMIENGFVHLPDAAPWLAPYLHELTTFPNGRHDDQVDSTAQMLDWFKRGSGPSTNAGIFEWYRQRAAELRRGETAKRRTVRLRVPPGIGRMNMLHLNVAADGTVEMAEDEVESFLRAGWVRVDAGDAPAQQSGDPQTARPEPLSVMAKRLGILRPL
jgi:predicted phage terminase large subunit-like protein